MAQVQASTSAPGGAESPDVDAQDLLGPDRDPGSGFRSVRADLPELFDWADSRQANILY